MVVMGARTYSQRKQDYKARLLRLLDEYSTVLIVQAENVGSGQMQSIRQALRGRGVMLMGKNTLIRTVIREKGETQPEYNQLADAVRGNVGLVFTNEDVSEIRKEIEANQVPAAARVGLLAPTDCKIPAGPTGLDPGQTSFFQALNIGTKIVKGSINIMNEVHLIKAGERVNASAVSLLSKLNVKPFFFSMIVKEYYDSGCLIDVKVLDMSEGDLLGKFFHSVNTLASVSLAAGIANLATVSHSLARAFKNVLALAVVSDFSFKESLKYEEYLADPAAYAAAHGLSLGGGGGGGGGAGAAAAAAPEPEEEEEEEEEEEDAGFSLFD